MIKNGPIIRYDLIDPPIVSVIEAINRLSFVKMTHYSCAGYGPVSLDGGHKYCGAAYFAIEYRPKTSWRKFHKALMATGIPHRSYVDAQSLGDDCVPANYSCSYYLNYRVAKCISGNECIYYENSYRQCELRSKWAQIKKFVEAYE